MRLASITLALLAIGIASVAAAPVADTGALEVRTEAADAAVLETREPKKKKNKKVNKGHMRMATEAGKVTWYGGGQLNAPACGGKTPSKHARVVAVKKGGQFKCGDTVHMHYKGKSVSAKVVDYCAGCDANHVDATQGTFSELAELDKGLLNNVRIMVS